MPGGSRHTDQEIVDMGTRMVRQTIADNVQAWRALGVSETQRLMGLANIANDPLLRFDQPQPKQLFLVGVEDEMQPFTPNYGTAHLVFPSRTRFEFYLTLDTGHKVILTGDSYEIRLEDWDPKFLPPNARRII